MANDLSGVGRGPISGGYQGPVVLPGSRQAGRQSRPGASADGAALSRALVPFDRSSSTPAVSPVEVLRPSDRTRAADSIIDLTPIDPRESSLPDWSRFVVVDGRRYDLDAPRGTYFNFIV